MITRPCPRISACRSACCALGPDGPGATTLKISHQFPAAPSTRRFRDRLCGVRRRSGQRSGGEDFGRGLSDSSLIKTTRNSRDA